MPNESNAETSEGISRKIKTLRSRCAEVYNLIQNSPLDIHDITPDNANEKTLCYIEGLGTEISNANVILITDDNLLTSQFLHEITEKTNHVQDLIAYTKACVNDVNIEIKRYETLIETAQQVKSSPAVRTQDVQHEHLIKAKEMFRMLKGQLHGLLQTLFPRDYEMISDILRDIMVEKMNENSNGYIPVTPENYQIVKLLTDMNIVSINPYNNQEFKLAY